MAVKKLTAANTNNQPLLENPPALPSWTPPTAEEIEAATERTVEGEMIEELLSFRPRPDEEHLARRQGETLFLVAQRLRGVNRRILMWIGRIAVAVEDFYLWRYVPGCDSPNDFWRMSGWPLTTVRTAVALQRSAVPLASALGLDLGPYEEDLSSVKAQALTRLAKANLGQVATYDDEAKQRLREQMLEVVGMPQAEVIKAEKASKAAKRTNSPATSSIGEVVVREEPLEVQEDQAYRVKLSIVTGVGGAKVHGEFEWDSAQLDAAIDKRAYPIYTYSGIEYDLAHMRVELDAFLKAKQVHSQVKPQPQPAAKPEVKAAAKPAPATAPVAVPKPTGVSGGGKKGGAGAVGESGSGAAASPEPAQRTRAAAAKKSDGKSAKPAVDFDDFPIDELGWDTEILPNK